jgi:nucleoside-diphosphate-sugar epimerase
LNITGPETLSVREIATSFGKEFGVDPVFSPGSEGNTSLLNDSSHAQKLFGPPSVEPEELIRWTAAWIQQGGTSLNKPTHFEARDGKF